jgi:protein-tyrosine phosphatase
VPTEDPPETLQASPPPFQVVLVCTGNICRSPMGDVVLRHLAAGYRLDDGSTLAERLAVSSAGTGGWHAGEPMDPRARTSLERRGYRDHGHRARAFESAWIDRTDLVVCMDRGHRQTLAGLARAQAGDDRHDGRFVLLRSFDGHRGGDPDVPDPFYGDDDGFDDCLDLVEAGCAGLVGHLAVRLGGGAG